jgi:hypothetical protein
MQNPYPTDPVFITLADGKERQLRYTMRSLQRLKAKFGKSLLGGGLGDLDEDTLPELVHAGLVNPDLTAEDVADNITAPMIPYVASCFARAFGMSMPEPSTEARPTTEPATVN